MPDVAEFVDDDIVPDLRRADEEPGVEAEGVLGAAAAPAAPGSAVAHPGGDEAGDPAPVLDGGVQDLRGVTAVMGFVEFPDLERVGERGAREEGTFIFRVVFETEGFPIRFLLKLQGDQTSVPGEALCQIVFRVLLSEFAPDPGLFAEEEAFDRAEGDTGIAADLHLSISDVEIEVLHPLFSFEGVGECLAAGEREPVECFGDHRSASVSSPRL